MINCNDYNDLQLHANYKSSGENEWLACLFKRYSRFVIALSMKYLKDYESSKDAAMQIFERLIFDLKKHEVSNFKSWLHSVTRNHCLMHMRTTKMELIKNEQVSESELSFMEYESFLHQEDNNKKESKLLNLEQAITQLNDEQRTCITLFFLQEKCYQEVTEITGFTMNQVKSYIQNGKRNLQLLMQNNNENE